MRRANIVSAMLLGLVLGAGCVEPAEPEELAQGVTVLGSSDESLAVAYRKDDVVIYMEALRGRPTAEPYQLDVLSPKFEVDARMIADDGRMFFLQRGGDHYIDPSWAEDEARQNEMGPSRESNRILFDMAGEAGEILDLSIDEQLGRDSVDSMLPVISALRTMSLQAPATYVAMLDERLAHLGGDGSEVEMVPYGGAGPESPDVGLPANYYWNVGVHSDDIDGSPAGYHSAARVNRWDGYWAFAADFCNHGRCPYQDGMPVTCWVNWDAPVGSDLKPAWTAYTCNTGYALYSDDGGHNCHDDTRLIMASFVFGNGRNRDPGWSYWCNGNDDDSDISVNIWGWETDNSGYPECSNSDRKGWEHPHMCRRQGNHGYNGAGGCYCDAACTSYGDCCIDGPY